VKARDERLDRRSLAPLARRLRATLNDRRALARACALKALTGVLVGGIWHGAARSPSFRDGTRAVSSALFLLVNNSAMDAVTDAILLVTSDGRLLAREYANGHFATNAYYLALQAAVMARATVGGLLIVAPARALIGLSPTAAQAVAFFSVLTAVSCIGATLGVLVGALAGDVDAARSAIVPTLGPLLLFSGFLIPRTLIPPLFKWAYYASFFQCARAAHGRWAGEDSGEKGTGRLVGWPGRRREGDGTVGGLVRTAERRGWDGWWAGKDGGEKGTGRLVGC